MFEIACGSPRCRGRRTARLSRKRGRATSGLHVVLRPPLLSSVSAACDDEQRTLLDRSCCGRLALTASMHVPGLRVFVRYVAHDVEITLDLAEICGTRGLLYWVTRSGRRRKLALPNGWLSVRLAEKLPRTGTSWMWPQWSRARFTAWLDREAVQDLPIFSVTQCCSRVSNLAGQGVLRHRLQAR